MSNAAKNQNEFQDGADSAEMPTVTTLLRRKKLAAVQGSNSPAPPAPVLLETPSFESTPISITKSFSATPTATAYSPPTLAPTHSVTSSSPTPTLTNLRVTGKTVRQTGEPPEFKATLIVPHADLNGFKKNLKAHKKSSSMKKLDCIGYFNMRFDEVAYFELDHSSNFKGVVGFGSQQLIRNTKQSVLVTSKSPSLSELIAAGNSFVGSIEAFQPDCAQSVRELGFKNNGSLGVFPVFQKKSIVGVWICTSSQFVQIDAKELKNLKKILTDIF